ncbi:nucleobase:cation symporter-2 family protein [Aliiglaciecola sp. 2_MG-2023]|uniref:uracil-xanthine permease family protein n=1 Tax=unclassified Aliiglaciecola TaxID=2593648 RepID=UPI0026E3CA02|nr:MULTISPECIES: nucleobase:cation symporter-2 family protein [unclassified Aliiglaciecola]MDO6711732.1 nucleobase:cation symporter-2 family protein [Aliiglaciecola sp. 2_MG-2023]MDO6752803.1 nucleobase:cation symporter-2 family protein [Aliiglaciecola sp. 1_MG-2023]
MKSNSELLYGLNDIPSKKQSITAATQHILACFVGIITPTLIIGGTLGLQAELPYLLSMALFVSGVATFIQAKTIGPIGSGLIAVQGTSFSFVSAILVAGFAIKAKGGSNEEVLSTIFGVCLLGAFIEVVISQFITKVRRIVTPLTTGIVITTIGFSLIKVGMTDLAGGFGSDTFGDTQNLYIGIFVLVTIIVLNVSSNPWVRLSAIMVGMGLGTLLAYWLGIVSVEHIGEQPLFSIPVPFKYGLNFDWEVFLPVALIYLMTALESSGDLTANSLFCGLPIKGEQYLKRIKGGILADGVNSALASVFNTFPNTTFGQNNAVIQLTGVASRHVGFYIAGILVLLGLFPVIGGVLQSIPKPVLGGATLVMFATIAVAGIKILASEPIDRRKTLIMATSFGAGFGVLMEPNALQGLPEALRNIFSSAITTSGVIAIVMSLLIPDPVHEEERVSSQS